MQQTHSPTFVTYIQQFFFFLIAHHSFFIGLIVRLLIVRLTSQEGFLDEDAISSNYPPSSNHDHFFSGVHYTDVDYYVYTDAAAYIRNHQSPYQRQTYRYTPFLAHVLSWVSSSPSSNGHRSTVSLGFYHLCIGWWYHSPKYFGKFLFCFADSICGVLIVQLRRFLQDGPTIRTTQKRRSLLPHPSPSSSPNQKEKSRFKQQLQDSFWWLYNPLPINICTRGSAESFIVLLPVLICITMALQASTEISRKDTFVHQQHTVHSNTLQMKRIYFFAICSGFFHGLAIHTKLYPIIYLFSFMAYFTYQEEQVHKPHHDLEKETDTKNDTSRNQIKSFHQQILATISQIRAWIFRIASTPSSLLFFLSSMITFVTCTSLGVYLYGIQALQEGLLYHFIRVDHRHNYSFFWYYFYLVKGRNYHSLHDAAVVSLTSTSWSRWTAFFHGKAMLLKWSESILLLSPQGILIVLLSFGVAPYDITFALFLQTFLFVAQNKVITAQYFTWYLCLLPLCSDRIQWFGRTKEEKDKKTNLRLGKNTFPSVVFAFGLLVISIGLWLAIAFCLEMLGLSVHLYLWMASNVFFLCNLFVCQAILQNYQGVTSLDGRMAQADEIKQD